MASEPALLQGAPPWLADWTCARSVDKDNEGNGTLERLKKDSFAWYQHVIETNGAEL